MPSNDNEADLLVAGAESTDDLSENESSDDEPRSSTDKKQNQAIRHSGKFSWFCEIIAHCWQRSTLPITQCCLSLCCVISFPLGIVVGQVGILEESSNATSEEIFFVLWDHRAFLLVSVLCIATIIASFYFLLCRYIYPTGNQISQANLQLLKESNSGNPDACNQQLIRVVKFVATEFLESYLKNMKIGKIQFDGGEITDLRISSVSLESFNLEVSGENLVLCIQGAIPEATASWKVNRVLGACGDVKISIKALTTSHEIAFQKKDGRLSIIIEERLVCVDGLKVKISGGVASRMIDWMVNLFVNKIKKTLQNKICKKIKKLESQINQQLSRLGGR